MFGKCGSLGDAEAAFHRISRPNVFSWTLMMAAYAQNGKPQQAVQLMHHMDLEGSCRPDSFIFACALGACIVLEDLFQGRALHLRIVAAGLDSDLVLQNCLSNLYAKCGRLSDARNVFDMISNKDQVSWNSMLAAHVDSGDFLGTLQFHRQMNQLGSKADEITFLCLARACADARDLKQARILHALVTDAKKNTVTAVQNGLVNMYAKCGSLEDARRVFEEMSSCCNKSWSCLIDGYAQAGCGTEALQVFRSMIMEGVKPDCVTFIATLGASCRISDVTLVRKAAAESGLANSVGVATALINSYSRCRIGVHVARETFDQMRERSVVSWNSMIAAYTRNGLFSEASQLFRTLNLEGLKPTLVTYVNVLGACADLRTVGDIVWQIDCSGLELTTFLENSLLNTYGSFGMLADASRLFRRMAKRNVVSWTTMLGAYNQLDRSDETFQLFRNMELEGVKPNEVTLLHIISAVRSAQEGKQVHDRLLSMGLRDDLQLGNALMIMYTSYECVERASEVFHHFRSSSRNAVPWTNMMSQFCQRGLNAEAVELYWEMNSEGVEADEYTYASVLLACSNQRDLGEGRAVHERVVEGGFEEDRDVGCALVNFYAECGSLSTATVVFAGMMNKDVVTWTSMIGANAHHGLGRQAMEVFEEMNLAGIEPNQVSFTCILNACSHVGLFEQSRDYFTAMTQDYKVVPSMEHYRCVVDALGRSGKLDEAECLAAQLSVMAQPSNQADAGVAPTILLNACRMHGDPQRGARAARACSSREPTSYVLLSQL